jgi:hypothetical protein
VEVEGHGDASYVDCGHLVYGEDKREVIGKVGDGCMYCQLWSKESMLYLIKD